MPIIGHCVVELAHDFGPSALAVNARGYLARF
jgi:hypothetical protein